VAAVTATALLVIAALVLVNGFFVAAEFALVSVRRGQISGESLAARLARRQQDKLDEYLSACQLGITIASLALGALGEPTLARLIEPVLHSIALAHVAGILGSVLALLVMTTLHITVGEQAPKSFAIGSAGVVAKFCAVPLEVFHRGLRPLVIVLNNASNAIVRLFGGTPASSHAQQASLEELRQLIGGLSDEGQIDRAEAQILQGVFTLDERRAGDVMTPRTRLTSLRAGQTVREALEATRDAGHSRFPLLTVSGDLLGVVYGRELTEALLDQEDDRAVEAYRHEMVIVPETLPLDALLARLQQQRATICAVIDEYGGLTGVVTVEDILEEIVGEIWDEDDMPSSIRLLADGRVVSRGDTSLLDLEEYGVIVEDARGSSVTIGGAIQDALGRLARPGDTVRLGRLRATVLSTDRGRVKRVVLAMAVAVAYTAA
jgi:CBS domain containing-hemolysin-like protein